MQGTMPLSIYCVAQQAATCVDHMTANKEPMNEALCQPTSVVGLM